MVGKAWLMEALRTTFCKLGHQPLARPQKRQCGCPAPPKRQSDVISIPPTNRGHHDVHRTVGPVPQHLAPLVWVLWVGATARAWPAAHGASVTRRHAAQRDGAAAERRARREGREGLAGRADMRGMGALTIPA
jgi:hypothetical protein